VSQILIAASGTSKVPFYVAGLLLAAWAVVLAAIGLNRLPRRPSRTARRDRDQPPARRYRDRLGGPDELTALAPAPRRPASRRTDLGITVLSGAPHRKFHLIRAATGGAGLRPRRLAQRCCLGRAARSASSLACSGRARVVQLPPASSPAIRQ
jgi:hypothetical protein